MMILSLLEVEEQFTYNVVLFIIRYYYITIIHLKNKIFKIIGFTSDKSQLKKTILKPRNKWKDREL